MSFTDDSSREITPLKLYFEGEKKKIKIGKTEGICQSACAEPDSSGEEDGNNTTKGSEHHKVGALILIAADYNNVLSSQ